jgi:hypothetical protein
MIGRLRSRDRWALSYDQVYTGRFLMCVITRSIDPCMLWAVRLIGCGRTSVREILTIRSVKYYTAER